VVLNERNLGYAVSNNRAAAVAEGRLLALLNNDLVLQPGWLPPMLAAHRALGPRAGVVGNVQTAVDGGHVDHAGIRINLKGKPEHVRTLPFGSSVGLRRVVAAEAVTGACLLIDRGLWGELGGFDESYHNGCEDVDLCFRAAEAGRRNVVALRSRVRHHVSSSPGRKRRDEANTQSADAALARPPGHALAARRWCADYLWREWTHPREPKGWPEAASALALPAPPAAAALPGSRWPGCARPSGAN
jgi:GT2 family glycosyltransferase